MLVPLAFSLALADGAHWAYVESLAATATAGTALWLATFRAGRELKVRDGFLLVALVWTVLPAFATLPLLLQLGDLSFTDAYFEAVSGLTASGATVLSGLDRLPPSLNIWRGFMIWIGGMGVIVLAVAIMPLLGVGGSQLFKAETPTPMKDTKLTPRIAETAKGLWLVYFGLTVACGLAYHWAGMSWLDSLMHAFTTLGLGGFSTHDESYAYWNSPRIEAVAIGFMLIAAINFATHFLAWHRRSLRAYQIDPEAKWFLGVVVVSVLGIAAYLVWDGIYADYATALRYAAFNVVSIATTTGYANTDFNLWPIFAPLWMLFLCSFASCSGSTGSGMKMIRAQILFKQIFRELLRIIHPRVTNPVKLGGQLVENNVVFAVLAYVFVYVSCIILFTLLLTLSGSDVVTAFSAAVVSLNNTGPGLAQVGPASNYAVLNDFQTWVCSFGMLLGRLELFTLLVVLTPAFWRK
ncbi:MAG: TrkH family potassium uptake protein [Betaproteobacteria bacterium]|nr:TrkH family potassium uptake protein [Betaproteobacteria bacterium]MDH4325403.1 TrkH family potassium uptake protein [Betaproteobacteria bacterium]MDH5210184.1 TrkH family potassium uptake protein [Betaproteobacteria bacterium]